MKIPLHPLAPLVLIAVLAVAGRAQTFVGNLDGISVQSTFTTSTDGAQPVNVPFGWMSVSGANPIVFGQTSNDVLIANLSDPFSNYKVAYDTGATLLASSTYTLSVSMGFVSGGVAGTASYQFSLGTSNGVSFTPLQTVTGTINRSAGPTSGASFGNSLANAVTVSVNYTTAASGLSIDPIYVQWEQTASSGTAGSDFFGIDNVTLGVSAIPEPSTYAMIFGAVALGLAWWRRRLAPKTAPSARGVVARLV